MKRLLSATKQSDRPVDVDKRQLKRLQLENAELRKLLEVKNKDITKPPQDQRVLVEFGLPDRISKPTDPFLWGKLVQENVTLKNKLAAVEQLTGELRDQLEAEKELKRRAKQIQPSAVHEQKISELTSKVEELQRKLAFHRKNESELRSRLQQHEERQQEAKAYLDQASYKYGRVGQMEQQIVQLRQKKQLYQKRHNDSMLASFKEKFPIYHESVFQTLRVYKQLERATVLDPTRKAELFLGHVLKAIVRAARFVSEAVTDWIRYTFYRKESYHPSNLELVETMLEKWRTTNQSELLNEVRFRQKQVVELTRQMEKMQQLLEGQERTADQLESNNIVILERNKQLEEMLRYNAHDFGYTLYHKLKRYEEDRRDLLAPVEDGTTRTNYEAFPQPFQLLIEPEYLHLKSLIDTLRQATTFNRQPELLEQQRTEMAKRQIIEEHVVANKHQYARPKRTVTVLKKNVYGYWEDPIFPTSQIRKKQPYRRLMDKHTQTTWETESAQRSFFKVTVYNGLLRLTNIKIDPYLKLSYGLAEKRTSAKSGRQPFWNESFTFEEAQPFLNLRLYDKNKLGHDTDLGGASVDLSEVFRSTEEKELRVQARIEDESKGFTGRVWIGLTMLERQRVIHIEEIQGSVEEDLDLLSDMDPYLQFSFDGKLVDSTPVLRSAGRTPIWRQEFDLLPSLSNVQLEVCMFDEDVMKDDQIGNAQQRICDLPEELEDHQLELLKEQKKVGVLRFKISSREYVNGRIQKKEPFLAALNDEERMYFEIGQAKLKLDGFKLVVGASLAYTAEYCGKTFTSKFSKGAQLFWPEMSVFQIQSACIANVSLIEKPMIGQQRSLSSTNLDLSSQIDNNYEGKEQLAVETGKGTLLLHINILKSVKVLFVGAAKLQFTRKTMRKDLSIRIASDLIPLTMKGADFQTTEDFTAEVLLDDSKQDLKIQLYEGRELISSSTLPTKKIMVDFMSEVAVELKNKNDKTGGLLLRLGIKVFPNKHIKPRPKEKVKLAMPYREYYRLLVHKAVLTRDTEVFGQMKTYCQLGYSSRVLTTPVKLGKTPVWDAQFLLYRDNKSDLSYRLLDQESVGNDDLIGEGQLNLERYLTSGTQDIIGQVYYQQKGVGNVFFSLIPLPTTYVISVTHIRAELYEDSDWIGKIDPYAEFEVGGQVIYRTEVLNECGQNPQWSIAFEIQVADDQSFRLTTLFKDKDLIGSDYLGSASFTLEQLSEYLTQIEAVLMKDNQELGRVYLTAAFIKFVNKNELKKPERQRPQLLDNLELRWLHIGELSSKPALDNPELTYSYPFERHLQAVSGDPSHFYHQQIIGLRMEGLRIELHSKNMLGVSSVKAIFEVPEDSLKKMPSDFSVLDLSAVGVSREEGQYSLRVGISPVESTFVCYFQEISLREAADGKDFSALLVSDLEERKVSFGAQDKVWLCNQTGDLRLVVQKSSLLSVQQVGQIAVTTDMLPDEYLEWRDFEVFSGSKRICVISTRCCKIKFEKPFANRCCQSKRAAETMCGVTISKIITLHQTTRIQASDLIGKVVGKTFTEKFRLKENTTVWLPTESRIAIELGGQRVAEVVPSNREREAIFYLRDQKKRFAITECSFQTLSTEAVYACLITLCYLRVEVSDQFPVSSSLEFSISYGNKTYTTETLIGKYCYFEECWFGLAEKPESTSIELVYTIFRRQSKEVLLTEKIAIIYQEDCYYEGKLVIQRGSYAVEHCTGSQRISVLQERQEEPVFYEGDVFELTKASLQLSEAAGLDGAYILSILYDTNEMSVPVQIRNGGFSCDNTFHLEWRDSAPKQQLQLLVKDRRDEVKFTSNLSIVEATEMKSAEPINITGQVFSGRLALGMISVQLRFVQQLDFRMVQLKKLYFPEEQTGTSIKWTLSHGLGVLQKGTIQAVKSTVEIESKFLPLFGPESLQLQVESRGTMLGRTTLTDSESIQPLGAEEINGAIKYEIKKAMLSKRYGKRSADRTERQRAEISSFVMESLLLCNLSNETVFLRAEANGKIIESEHLKLVDNHLPSCSFWLFLSSNVKLSVLRKSMRDDELIGECSVDFKAFNVASHKLYFKGEVVGLVACRLKPAQNDASFYRICKLATSNLKNTELLAKMTPYVRIIDEKGRVYRTTVALGRNNLAWDVDIMLPITRKITFEVRDRDMMFDDDVGKVEVDVAKALQQQTNQFNLSLKGKNEGILTCEFSPVELVQAARQSQSAGTEGKLLGVRIHSLRLTDRTLRTDLCVRVRTISGEATFAPYHREKGELFFSEQFFVVEPESVVVQVLVSNSKYKLGDVLLAQLELSTEHVKAGTSFKLTSINNSGMSLGDLAMTSEWCSTELRKIEGIELVMVGGKRRSWLFCCFPKQSRFARFKSNEVVSNGVVRFPDKFYYEAGKDLTLKVHEDDSTEFAAIELKSGQLDFTVLSKPIVQGKKVMGYAVINTALINCRGAISLRDMSPTPQSMKKWIHLTIVKAELSRDVEILGKMDPYCTFVAKGKRYTTPVEQDKGKNPTWNAQFLIDEINQLQLIVMDSEVLKDREVGRCTVALDGQQNTFVCDLIYKGDAAGKLHLKYSTVRQYVRFSQAASISQTQNMSVVVEQPSCKVETNKDASLMMAILEVPIIHERLTVRFGKSPPLVVQVQELKAKSRGWIDSPDKEFEIGYQFFSGE